MSSRKDPEARRRLWCCSFAVPPSTPHKISAPHSKAHLQKNETPPKPIGHSAPNSPQSSKSGLGFVDRITPRRMSPGRVSPIDSDPSFKSIQETGLYPSSTVYSASHIRTQSFRAPSESHCSPPEILSGSGNNAFDVRLNLRGKKGESLVLELNTEVLCANSEVFAGLISDYRKNTRFNYCSASRMCRVEVPEVENLGVFRETIELMFVKDISKHLLKIGVYRAIDILEVSAGIKFTKGILSCLKYLEAVPWTETEEEKIKNLFMKFTFDEAATKDVLARLYLLESSDTQQNLARSLVCSITTCTDVYARNELKSLVKGLLCRSSIYEKDHQPDLNKYIYAVCWTCLASLVTLFVEASEIETTSPDKSVKMEKPLLVRISRQVDNINWLLDILLDWEMAEDFVDLWADQGELLKMHESSSPLIRYELSRVSAILFIAMGTRKLHCCLESKSRLLQSWLGPMMLDFGWLQRCRKGLDMKILEEAMGESLLTLPLNQQYILFTEWFGSFSKHGAECPNLSKAFQIWWHRSFLRGSETNSNESR